MWFVKILLASHFRHFDNFVPPAFLFWRDLYLIYRPKVNKSFSEPRAGFISCSPAFEDSICWNGPNIPITNYISIVSPIQREVPKRGSVPPVGVGVHERGGMDEGLPPGFQKGTLYYYCYYYYYYHHYYYYHFI